MPIDLSMINVISPRHKETPTDDFNNGRATVGTRPFTQANHAQGGRMLLARNDDCRGEKPQWGR